MLLETRLEDDTYILIDAEPMPGIGRNDGQYNSPADALENMLRLAAQVTRRFKDLLDEDSTPDRMGVTFGVRVDGNATVSLARKPDNAQFQITAEWSKPPG